MKIDTVSDVEMYIAFKRLCSEFTTNLQNAMRQLEKATLAELKRIEDRRVR